MVTFTQTCATNMHGLSPKIRLPTSSFPRNVNTSLVPFSFRKSHIAIDVHPIFTSLEERKVAHHGRTKRGQPGPKTDRLR